MSDSPYAGSSAPDRYRRSWRCWRSSSSRWRRMPYCQPGFWGGGVRHLPSLVALLLCGTWFATRGMSDGARRTGKMLWLAAALLAAGLLFRSVDLSLCDAFPHGVHWVWHVFTGCTLGVLLFAAIGHSSSAKSITP